MRGKADHPLEAKGWLLRLRDVRYWEFCATCNRIYTWRGGQGVNVYRLEGQEVDYFVLGGAATHAKKRDIQHAIKLRCQTCPRS